MHIMMTGIGDMNALAALHRLATDLFVRSGVKAEIGEFVVTGRVAYLPSRSPKVRGVPAGISFGTYLGEEVRAFDVFFRSGKRTGGYRVTFLFPAGFHVGKGHRLFAEHHREVDLAGLPARPMTLRGARIKARVRRALPFAESGGGETHV